MDLQTPAGIAALAAVVSALVAIASLASNTVIVVVLTPRRDHEAWRRGRLEQHVLEILQLVRRLRAELTNFQVAPQIGTDQTVEDLMHSEFYLSTARPLQESQFAVLDAGLPQLSAPVDAVTLLGSNYLAATVNDLTEAVTEMRRLLDHAVRAVDPRVVAFGPGYARALKAWFDAEKAFETAARRELGVRSRLLRDLGSRWRWFR